MVGGLPNEINQMGLISNFEVRQSLMTSKYQGINVRAGLIFLPRVIFGIISYQFEGSLELVE